MCSVTLRSVNDFLFTSAGYPFKAQRARFDIAMVLETYAWVALVLTAALVFFVLERYLQ
jgi:hypothetical protein